MATVYVDDKPYPMNPEENLLHGCLAQGLNLPYFCWHPALGSVGACRQCAVKLFKDEHDHARQNRDVLHDAGRRGHAHLDRRIRRLRHSARASSKDSC